MSEAGLIREGEDHAEVYEQLRTRAGRVTGAPASLRAKREALTGLVALVNGGNRSPAVVRPAAEAAAGKSGAEELVRPAPGSGGRITVREIAHGRSACPACRSSLSVVAEERLLDASKVHRCNCGLWLVRSLEP